MLDMYRDMWFCVGEAFLRTLTTTRRCFDKFFASCVFSIGQLAVNVKNLSPSRLNAVVHVYNGLRSIVLGMLGSGTTWILHTAKRQTFCLKPRSLGPQRPCKLQTTIARLCEVMGLISGGVAPVGMLKTVKAWVEPYFGGDNLPMPNYNEVHQLEYEVVR